MLLSTGQGVLGHNCYAYCLNNSIIRIDEGGSVPYLIIPDYGGDYDPSKEGFREAFDTFRTDVEKAVAVETTSQGVITISIEFNYCLSSLHSMTQAADLDYSCHMIEDEIHGQLYKKRICYTPSYKEGSQDIYKTIKKGAKQYLQWCYPKQYPLHWDGFLITLIIKNAKKHGRKNKLNTKPNITI